MQRNKLQLALLVLLCFFLISEKTVRADDPNMCATGFGSTNYNGTWTLSGTSGGDSAPYYTNDSNFLYYGSEIGAWVFGPVLDDNTTGANWFYYSNVEYPSFPSGQTYTTNAGNSPAGTVSISSCTTPAPSTTTPSQSDQNSALLIAIAWCIALYTTFKVLATLKK